MNGIPQQRHPDQLSLSCRFLAPAGTRMFGQTISHADKLLVRAGGREFYVVLIGVAAPDPIIQRAGFEPSVNPAAIRAIAAVYRLIDHSVANDRLSVMLPPTPRPQSGCWEQGIANGSTHPGYLFLSDGKTLNQALVEAGVCRLPNRLDRSTLRRYAAA